MALAVACSWTVLKVLDLGIESSGLGLGHTAFTARTCTQQVLHTEAWIAENNIDVLVYCAKSKEIVHFAV